jgi:signal transduction histidine kinase
LLTDAIQDQVADEGAEHRASGGSMPSAVQSELESHVSENVDFAYLFENAPHPFAYVGPDLAIHACNKEFRDHFPVLVENLFLVPFKELLGDKSKSGENCFYLPLVQPRRNFPYQDFAALELCVSRLSKGGALVFLRSITRYEVSRRDQIKRLDHQVALARRQTREASRFLAASRQKLCVTSHELRTPLNAILGFSDILRQEIFGSLGDARYQRYADLIHQSGSRLLEMVNDFLDLSKIGAGKLDLHTRRIEVLRVILDSVRELEVCAAKSHVCVSVNVYDRITVLIADDKRLHQMLLNLLSNAIKFTREGGGINVDVFRRGDSVGISVSDTGTGVREEDIPTMLEPFGQLENGDTGNGDSGTGLGLPLTKELAELHGGTLEVESALGSGTTVTIFLPAEGPKSKHASHAVRH